MRRSYKQISTKKDEMIMCKEWKTTVRIPGLGQIWDDQERDVEAGTGDSLVLDKDGDDD
jgi:hypothetical protein